MVDDRLVTPEAVQLDLATATVATRGLGRALDVVIQGTALLLVFVGLTALSVGGELGTAGLVIGLLAFFMLRFVYPVVLETRDGATVGQRAMGLRIRTLDGGKIRGRQAVVRAAVGMVEIDMTFGLVAFVVAAARPDGRRLGDLAAGTVAVSVRMGTGPAQQLDVRTPPALAGWAVGIDPTGVDQPRRVALRRYHERAASLTPAVRSAVAHPLAERLVAELGLGWPAQASAHDVLAAIAASVSTAAMPPPPPLSLPGTSLPGASLPGTSSAQTPLQASPAPPPTQLASDPSGPFQPPS
ncbi:MAG: putative RDD family membrane protein YckC [Myxococcota bacterium]